MGGGRNVLLCPPVQWHMTRESPLPLQRTDSATPAQRDTLATPAAHRPMRHSTRLVHVTHERQSGYTTFKASLPRLSSIAL